jgi:predicted phosphodiesterase
MNKLKIKKAIVIPDCQVPYHDKDTMKVVEQYMADNKWDYYINLGDFLDYFTISRFNVDSPGLLEGKTILEECKQGKEILERHIDLVRKNNKDARIIYLEGNHERRAYDFANKFPHMKGIIEPENILEFKKNDVEYYKSWSENENFKIGDATFTHGRYTNQHHAKKMVDNFETNVFYGHLHDTNSYNKVSLGSKNSKVGQCLGCLCDYPKEVDYTKGSPKNWQQAVTTFYFFPDGTFTYYVSRIFNNQFVSPEGKVYSLDSKKKYGRRKK